MSDGSAHAVDYRYGAFPPASLAADRLLDPVAEATGDLRAYDAMLSTLPNSEILLVPLRNR